MKPKILFFDIETKPVKAWIWRTGKQFMSHDRIVAKEKFDIICICYKWLGEKKVHSLDWGIRRQNSEKMVEKFSKIVESADVVIGQNSDRFDIKQINTQRLLHNQDPISWPTSEDTLKQMRKHFYLTSFSLDYVSKLLTGSGKDPMAFQDWVDIVDGKCTKALDKMIKYCKEDVKKLEAVWKRLMPHVQLKAHRGVIEGKGRESCPNCASFNHIKYGFHYNRTNKKQRLKCNDCRYLWVDSRAVK